MKRYRAAWLILLVGAGALGVCLALTMGPWSAGLSKLLACSVIGGLVATMTVIRRRWRTAGRLGAAAGVAALATMGLALMLAAWVVLVVAIMAVCSPAVLVWLPRFAYWYRWRSGFPASEAPTRGMMMVTTEVPSPIDMTLDMEPEASTPSTTQAIGAMDDAAVCHAWRSSYSVLQEPLSSLARLQVVQRRQKYLNELERRDPQGFAAWMESGARAAGDPSEYIVRSEQRDDPDVKG